MGRVCVCGVELLCSNNNNNNTIVYTLVICDGGLFFHTFVLPYNIL